LERCIANVLKERERETLEIFGAKIRIPKRIDSFEESGVDGMQSEKYKAKIWTDQRFGIQFLDENTFNN
jgi:hypothetical protein